MKTPPDALVFIPYFVCGTAGSPRLDNIAARKSIVFFRQ